MKNIIAGKIIVKLVMDRSLFFSTPYMNTSQLISNTTITNDNLFHTPRNPKPRMPRTALVFFDLWPFYRRSDEELTVDTYSCLANTNTSALLLLSFDTFCNLTFFDLWPLIRRSDKEVTVDTFASSSKTTTLTLLLLSFDTFCNLTFFDLWPLIRRSDKEVTVDTFASSSKTTTLTLLLLSFDTFCNLTFLWPMTPLTIGRMKRSLLTLTHVCQIATH